MHFLSFFLPAAVILLPSVHGNRGGHGKKDCRAAKCQTLDFIISLNVTTADIPIPPPSSQAELTGSLVHALSPTAEHPQFALKQTIGDFSISALVCAPEHYDGDVVNFAVHGLGYTKSYWDVELNHSAYSFAEAAAKRGEATFAYDRLGTGKSRRADGQFPDAIQDVQIFTHIEVAKAMADIARDHFKAKTLIGIGHSYGSLTLLYLVAQYPDVVDAVALTGFSSDPESYSGRTAFALNVAIATEAYPDSFKSKNSLSNAYLVSGNEIADLTAFFSFPAYETAAVAWSTENKGTIAYGELLTFGPPTVETTIFSGAVLALSGASDFIFCSSDCNKESEPVQGLQKYFPNASDFSTVIIDQTGHAINLHQSAPKAYGAYGEWVQRISEQA